MKKMFFGKQNKGIAALLVGVLVACYLFATGVAAQESSITSSNLNITYAKEALSYGDVWAFDSAAHAATSYNLNGSKTLEWWTNGGSGNTDQTKSTYAQSYFQTAVITDGKLDTENSVPMAKLEYSAFNSGVQVGAVNSTAVSGVTIPVVNATGDAAGVYTVVPGKADTYYVHAYVQGATEDSINMAYAMLDSCEDVNAYAANGFSQSLSLNRIAGTDWYRGEVNVETMKYYAASIGGGGTSSNQDKGNSGSTGTIVGGVDASLSLGGDSDTTMYYYNDWNDAKAYYDTVLVFQVAPGTALGPISNAGSVIIENGDADKGTLTAQSIFGETVTVGPEAQTLPKMPIVLTVAANGDNMFMGFTNASGGEVTDYGDATDKANTMQNITAGVTYVYHHENNDSEATKVTAQWSGALSLPPISVSNDAAVYNFVNAKAGEALFVKGTQTDYVFTLDFAGVEHFASGTYSVTGDTINGVSTCSGEITAESNSFNVTAKYDETVVTVSIKDINGRDYTFKYTIKPTSNGAAVAKNLQTGVVYDYVEDAILEAASGQTVALLKNASLVVDGSMMSTKWLTNDAGFTVKSGVTLLVPFDDANTVITTNMKDVVGTDYTVYPAKTLYRQLTMPTGSKLIVDGGSINIGSKAHPQAVGQVGPYGSIVMDSGSNITLKNGSTMFAWGYIFAGANGAGTVAALDGSNIYENISVMDYPPGGAGAALHIFSGLPFNTTQEQLSNAAKAQEGGRAFPLRAYTVRNVEVPLTVNYGASVQGFYHVYGETVKGQGGFVTFIGKGSSAIFELKSADSSVTKSYVNGKQIMKFAGDVNLNPMEVTFKLLGSATITSSKASGLLIPSGYDVELVRGTATLNENVIVCEGAKFTVAEGTTMNLNGKNMHVLDADNDPGAVTTSEFPNAVDVHGNAYTNVNADAILDINGTFIAGSTLFTSAGKASIISSQGTGSIQFTSVNASNSLDLKYGQTAVVDDLPMTQAYLQNADGTYIQTCENTFTYKDGRWICATHTDTNPTDGVCDYCGYTTCTHTALTPVAAKAATCAEAGNSAYWTCTCDAWFSDAEGKNVIADHNSVVLSATGNHIGGKATCTAQAVCDICQQPYGDPLSHSYTGEWVTDENGHAQKCVNGCGLPNPQVEAHKYNASHMCECGAEETRTVIWKNEETVLETDEKVPYSETPEYNGETPTKEADAQYSYTFSTWSAPVTGENGTVIYTAVFNQTPQSYTITWKNGDDVVDTQTLAYGATVTRPSDPAKEGYTFTGWDPETPATMPANDLTINATWQINSYKVTWMNGSEVYKEENVAFGQAIVQPEAPTMETADCKQYTFTGWDQDIPATMPAENLTFTAQYSSEEEHNWNDEVDYTWNVSNGVATCTATHVCSVNQEHNVTVNATKVEKVVDKASTCTTNGNYHYKATFENVEWATTAEQEANKYTDLPLAEHNIQIVAANPATCTEDGNVEHWICTVCEKHFSDAEGKTEIAENSWIVAALNHKNVTDETEWQSDENNHWKICPDCEESVQLGEHSFTDGVCTGCGAIETVYYSISGTISSYGSETDPISIQLFAEGATEASYELTVTGNTASYTIEGVTSGKYTMKVSKNAHMNYESEVTVDAAITADITINLGSGTTAFRIASANLVLQDNINVKYFAVIPEGFESPYMVFTFNEQETVVREYTINAKDGRYEFVFPGVNPQCMGDNICATVYATYNGTEVSYTHAKYSVRQYCEGQLNKTSSSEKLKRLLSDLLVYGEKAQLYEKYKTGELVTAGLTLTPSTFTSLNESFNLQNITGEKSEKADWTSVSLYLASEVRIRLTVTTAVPSDYTYEITIAGTTTVYGADDLEPVPGSAGKYYLYVKGLNATGFDLPITAVIKKDGVQVGRSFTYSVYTYVYKNQDSTNTPLAEMLKAIYNYGNSAKNYNS